MKNEIKNTFIENHKLTYDLLNKLENDELILKWERPGLDTFIKHFLEMVLVQDAFCQAINTLEMSFDSVPNVFDFKNDKEKCEIIDLMEAADQRLYSAIDAASENTQINWYGMKIGLYTHIANLIQHEVFHQGMMAMILYKNKIEIPDSWIENWSLPQVNDLQ